MQLRVVPAPTHAEKGPFRGTCVATIEDLPKGAPGLEEILALMSRGEVALDTEESGKTIKVANSGASFLLSGALICCQRLGSCFYTRREKRITGRLFAVWRKDPSEAGLLLSCLSRLRNTRLMTALCSFLLSLRPVCKQRRSDSWSNIPQVQAPRRSRPPRTLRTSQLQTLNCPATASAAPTRRRQ
eukprot:1908932-Amphidinium_carterae.2